MVSSRPSDTTKLSVPVSANLGNLKPSKRTHKSDIAFSATWLSLVRNIPPGCKVAQFLIMWFCPTMQCRQNVFNNYEHIVLYLDAVSNWWFPFKTRFGNFGKTSYQNLLNYKKISSNKLSDTLLYFVTYWDWKATAVYLNLHGFCPSIHPSIHPFT